MPTVFLLLNVTRNVLQSDLFLRDSTKGIGFPLGNGIVAMMFNLFCSKSTSRKVPLLVRIQRNAFFAEEEKLVVETAAIKEGQCVVRFTAL